LKKGSYNESLEESASTNVVKFLEKKGTWEGGTWKGGIWEGGTWEGGRDRKGKFHKKGDSPDKW